MGEPVVLVESAGVSDPQSDAIQLATQRAHQIDRRRAPRRRLDIIGKASGDLRTDFEATGADTGPDGPELRHMACFGHFRPQHGNDSATGAPPACVCHTDGFLRDEHHTEAICGEDSHGETGSAGPNRIRLPGDAGVVDGHHGIPVNLTRGRPPIWYRQLLGEDGARPAIGPEVAIRPLAEGHPVHAGRSDHPWTKLGISRVSSSDGS
jgi:hypothetical protein